jgi:hypothetical protein
MDASLWVALLDLLWLVMLAFAWLKDKQNHIRIHEAQREWLESLSERLRDLEGRMKSKDAWEDAMTGAQIDRNIEMDGIRDRIDALSARMDAVELACGLREKAKTMGGQDG